MEEYIFKIKRISDGKYYKGKSKFTENGTYFNQSQMCDILQWIKILSKKSGEKLSISIYNADFLFEMNLDEGINMDELELILNRDSNLKKIITKL